MSVDIRFDPFSFQFKPVNIVAEPHVVQYFPAFKRVGFFLKETPQRIASQPIAITCGGDALSEVGRNSPPGVDNFRVDYGNVNNFAQVGFVNTHASRIGQVSYTNYRGLGAGLNSSHRADARANLERSVLVEKNATAQSLSVLGSALLKGSASMAAAVSAEIFFSGKTAKNVGLAIDDNDLVTIQKILSMSVQGGVEVFTPGQSGDWTPPLNTRYVFLAMIGGGGGGSAHFIGHPGAGGGGSGSPALYAIIDLNALGAGPYAYSVAATIGAQSTNPGSDGAHSTIFGCQSGHGGGGAYNTGTGAATGGTPTAGSLGAAVVSGRLVNLDVYGASLNGGVNSGTDSGAGGNGAAMLGNAPAAQNGVGSNSFFAGSGGAVPPSFGSGLPGGLGAGGSGGMGGGGAGGAGGGAAGGLIFLIY